MFVCLPQFGRGINLPAIGSNKHWRGAVWICAHVEAEITHFLLDLILLLLAEGSLGHGHFANAERLQFALEQRLRM